MSAFQIIDGRPRMDWPNATGADLMAAGEYLDGKLPYATWDDWTAAVAKARTRVEFEALQDAGSRLPREEKRYYWFGWIQSYASLYKIKLHPRRKRRRGDFQRQ